MTGNGLTIDSSATTSGVDYMFQKLEDAPPVGTYTLSVLVASVTGRGILTMADSGGNPLKSVYITEPGVVSVTAEDVSPRRVYIGAEAGGSITVKAVKLEHGSVQTLAHQDAGGTWVLNEIPDYVTELAKCQRYMVAYPTINTGMYWSGIAQTVDQVLICIPLPQSIRATPALVFDTGSFVLRNGTTDYPITAASVYTTSGNSVTLLVKSTGLTVGEIYALRGTVATKLIFDTNL